MPESDDKKRGFRGRPAGLALTVLILVAPVGCGRSSAPKTVVVQGKVTYKGQPVTQGYISFVPAKSGGGPVSRPATGTLTADGSYQLSTFGENDGAIPGEYQVVVISKSGGPTPEEPDAAEEWHVPEKYGTGAESGLTAAIPADQARVELNFALED
jgi:hypothetical protein